jgi:hypothetical protein
MGVTAVPIDLADTTGKSEPRRTSQLLWVMFASYFAFGSILNVVGVIIPIVIRQYQLSLFAGGLLAFAQQRREGEHLLP